jgi:hypothetical protein
LFINVPPIDRSPGTILQGPSYQSDEAADIADFNAGVSRVASNLTASYNDVTTFQFDANAVFTQILNDPAAFTQSAAIKNTTQYCQAYAK